MSDVTPEVVGSESGGSLPFRWVLYILGRFEKLDRARFLGGCATSMGIQMNDRRERLCENLKEATGKGHKSKALDQAAAYYLRMHGDTVVYSTGAIDEVLDAAEAEGSLTAQQIADLLDVDELCIEYKINQSVGDG